MTAGDWAAAVIGIAGVVVAMGAIPPSRNRSRIVAISAVLLVIAVGIGAMSFFVRAPEAPTASAGDEVTGSPTAPSGSPIIGDDAPMSQPTTTAPTAGALGIPLLGPEAPEGTFVAASGSTYFDDRSVSINGQRATRAMGAYCGGCGEGSFDASILLNVGRSYKELRARLGATDKTKSNQPVSIEIFSIDQGRSTPIYSKSFRIGESEDVVLPIANVLQLKFVFRGPMGRVYAGVGDPTAFR